MQTSGDRRREIAKSYSVVIVREGGASSTRRPIDSIITVSGILDRPPQCAIAHKADDDG